MKGELKSIEIKARKLMTMNWNIHPRENVGRLYLARKERGIGLASCEKRVNVEVENFEKYLSESEEWTLKFVAGEKRLSEVEEPHVLKKCLKEEKTLRLWCVQHRNRHNA